MIVCVHLHKKSLWGVLNLTASGIVLTVVAYKLLIGF